MILRLIYIIFIVSISFGGNYHIGPTTPRQIMAIVMFIICINNYKSIKPYFNKYIGLYILYLLFVSISAINDNSFHSVFRTLIAQHFVALVCYSAVVLYYIKFHDFKLLLKTLLVCGIVNGVVCMLQYMGNSIGMDIGYLFIDAEELQANRHMEQLIDGSGSGYLLGMRGDAVHNGYFQMIMPFILTYFYKIEQSISLLKSFLYYMLLAFLFAVILLIQERSCIIFTLFVFALYFYNSFRLANGNHKARYILMLVVGFVCIAFWGMPLLNEYLSQSRFASSEPNLRLILFNNALAYISDNLFLGGMATFTRLYEFPPHNIILNSFIEAGIFGFIIGSYIYIKQIKIALSVDNVVIYVFLVYTLNALLHNDSVLSGDAIAWILWGIIISIYNNQNNESINRIQGLNKEENK